jgi:hypothetical protein
VPTPSLVIAGLDPAIQRFVFSVLLRLSRPNAHRVANDKALDARIKSAHDE